MVPNPKNDKSNYRKQQKFDKMVQKNEKNKQNERGHFGTLVLGSAGPKLRIKRNGRAVEEFTRKQINSLYGHIFFIPKSGHRAGKYERVYGTKR